MNLGNILKIGFIVVAGLGLAYTLYEQNLAQPELTLPVGLITSSAQVNAPASRPKQNSTEGLANNNVLPFVVAPDYNDIFAAAQLLANAANKQKEKVWIDFRAGTRIARENAERAKAEHQQKQYEYDKELLSIKTEQIKLGDLSSLTPKPNGQQNPYGNQQASQIDGPKASSVELPDVQLLSFTKSLKHTNASVDLNVEGQLYASVKEGHSVRGYQVSLINNSSRCVTLTFQSLNNTLCME